jgi:hypothetical protein
MIGTLPAGSKGFDCNATVSPYTALKFAAAGYRFAVRYVRREQAHDFDVTPQEMVGLFKAGLAVMLVQHVAPPGWHPTGGLGRIYGETAAEEAGRAGASTGCTLWCDLEEVAHGTDRRDVIAYCNNWFDQVRKAGYDPGLYVGYRCGLTADDLYRQTKFQRYWAAYNLDKPNYPAVRGVQMRQYEATTVDHVSGVSFEFDVNIIGRDAMGGTPALMMPPMLAAA